MAKLIRNGGFRKALASYVGNGGGGGGDASTLNGQAGTYYLDRANHTGTQLAATISDFAAAVDARVGQEAVDIQNKLLLTGDITPAALTSDTDNYNPTGIADANILFLSSSSNIDLTGIAAQENGRVLILQNIGTEDIKLKNNNAGSLAANRFFLRADLSIKDNNGCILLYNTTLQRWLVVAEY